MLNTNPGASPSVDTFGPNPSSWDSPYVSTILVKAVFLSWTMMRSTYSISPVDMEGQLILQADIFDKDFMITDELQFVYL